MIKHKDMDFIDRYLHHKLSGESLDFFNDRVKNDPEFAAEVELMTKINDDLKNYGRQELREKLKTIAAKKGNRDQRSRRIVYWSIAASLLVLIGLSGVYFTFFYKQATQKFVFNKVMPPFKQADIKYREYQLEAGKGAVLSYYSGTIITVPKDAFVDKKGEVIKGNITVKYREMMTPEDLFIAGIPMTYDSSGHVSNLQTAGVCELQAFKNDTIIDVNPKNTVNIDFSTAIEKPGYRLLLFDTASKKWLKKGQDSCVVRLDEYAEVKEQPTTFVPRKADHSKPRFKLVYRDPSKFPEFEVYKNYSFEVSDNEKHYNPADAGINWKSVAINKDNFTGEYLVTFINPDRQVTYKTFPVFEDNDYLVALNTYKQKAGELQQKPQGKDTIGYETAQRIKGLQKELLKQKKEDFLAANIYRTFKVVKTGLWSYSKISEMPMASISVDFKDTKGDAINLKYVAILDKTINSIVRYTPEEFQSIHFDPASQNELVAITSDNNFAYLKKGDFAKLPKSGKCSVTLQTTTKKPESSGQIIALIS